MGMGVGSGNLSQYLLWALAHQLAKLPSLQLEASSSKLGPKCSCLWSQLGSCSAFSAQIVSLQMKGCARHGPGSALG